MLELCQQGFKIKGFRLGLLEDRLKMRGLYKVHWQTISFSNINVHLEVWGSRKIY